MFQLSLRVRQTGRENVRTTVENYRTTASRGKKTRFGQRNYIRLRDVVSKKVEKNYTRVRQRLKRKWQPQKRNKL